MEFVLNVTDLQLVQENEAMVNGEKWIRQQFGAWYKAPVSPQVITPVEPPKQVVVETPVVKEEPKVEIVEPVIKEVPKIEKVVEVVQPKQEHHKHKIFGKKHK